MEREETQDMITASTAGPLARIESAVFLIQKDVKYIEAHMKEANGRTGKNEEKISAINDKLIEIERELPHTQVNCPQNGTLKDLKEFVDKLKTKKEFKQEMGESILKLKEDKRGEFLKMLTTVSVVVAALALSINLIFSILGYSQRKELKEEVDKIEKIENIKK